jgi:hypothetical protein
VIDLPSESRKHLLEFAAGGAPAKNFEAWLYSSAEVEQALLPDEYLALISADFNSSDGVAQAQIIAEEILSRRYPTDLPKRRVLALASEMLAGTIDLLFGLRRLVGYYRSGYTFIPEVFVGLEDETESVPDREHYSQWEPNALARQLERLGWYRSQILAELKALVESLQRELPE